MKPPGRGIALAALALLAPAAPAAAQSMPKRLCLLAAALLPLSSPALAQDQADLAKAAQNPVAAIISLPFQNNTLFGVGPDDDVANVLNTDR